jgi:hypothetical protein
MIDFDWTVTESDIEQALRCGSAFSAEIRGDLKPSEVAGPMMMIVLRTRSSGFPVVTDTHVFVMHNHVAETLRSLYKGFLAGEISPQELASRAMPLIRELRSEVEDSENDEIQRLIEDNKP